MRLPERALSLRTPPTAEPLSLKEVKDHLVIDGDHDDAFLTRVLKVCRESVEKAGQLSMLTQTWTLQLAQWPHVIELARGPVQSVTSVKYFDVDGNVQTLVVDVDYQLALKATPPSIAPAPDACWPTLQHGKLLPIEVVYVAGYGDEASDVPADLVHAVALEIGSYQENREDETEVRTNRLHGGRDRLVSHERNVSAV